MNYLVLGVIIFLALGAFTHFVLRAKDPAWGFWGVAALPALSDWWAALTFVVLVSSGWLITRHVRRKLASTATTTTDRKRSITTSG